MVSPGWRSHMQRTPALPRLVGDADLIGIDPNIAARAVAENASFADWAGQLGP